MFVKWCLFFNATLGLVKCSCYCLTPIWWVVCFGNLSAPDFSFVGLWTTAALDGRVSGFNSATWDWSTTPPTSWMREVGVKSALCRLSTWVVNFNNILWAAFLPDFLLSKKSQTQNVSTEEQCKTLLCKKLCIKCCWNWDLLSISWTFYDHLLRLFSFAKMLQTQRCQYRKPLQNYFLQKSCLWNAGEIDTFCFRLNNSSRIGRNFLFDLLWTFKDLSFLMFKSNDRKLKSR